MDEPQNLSTRKSDNYKTDETGHISMMREGFKKHSKCRTDCLRYQLLQLNQHIYKISLIYHRIKLVIRKKTSQQHVSKKKLII